MEASALYAWKKWQLYLLFSKSNIPSNDSFLESVLKLKIDSNGIRQAFYSHFKVIPSASLQSLLNPETSEIWRTILTKTEVSATEVSEMKLQQLIAEHFDTDLISLGVRQTIKNDIKKRIIQNPQHKFEGQYNLFKKNIGQFLGSNEFRKWKKERKKIIESFERKSLCLLFERRINKEHNIDKDNIFQFKTLANFAQIFDPNGNNILDTEPWEKFTGTTESMFGEFYDFLLSKEIKESEIETLYGILRENDNIAGFKQTEIALAYLYSMVVASFGLNRVQQQLLRIIIRMMNLKNARLQYWIHKFMKENDVEIQERVLEIILNKIKADQFYRIDFENRFEKEQRQFHALKKRLKEQICEIENIHTRIREQFSKFIETSSQNNLIELIEYQILNLLLETMDLTQIYEESDRQVRMREIGDKVNTLKIKIQKQNQYSQHIKQLMSEIQTNSNERFSNLIKLRKILSTFDISQFCELIQKDNSQIYENEKDAILVMGPTETGKSTLIQNMLGYSFFEKVNKDQTKEIILKESLRQQHIELITSNSTESQTQNVTFFEIPKESFSRIPQGKHYFIGDTPGLLSSKGPQIDAANSRRMLERIKGFRSVTMIHIIHGKNNGLRCKALKQLATFCAKLIDLRTLKQQMKKMPIVFIYNKMTVEEVAELRRSVRDILSRLETVDRESSYGIYFALLLQDLTKKVTVFNPLNFDTKAFFDRIVDESDSVETNSLGENFSFETEKIIELCLLKQLNSFKSSFEIGDHLKAQYHFTRHSKLVKGLNWPISKEFKIYLSNKSIEIQKQAKKNLKTLLEYSATVKDFIAFQESITELTIFQIYKHHFTEDCEFLQIEKVQRKVLEQVSEILFSKYYSHIQSNETELITRNLTTQKLFSEHFPCFTQLFENSVQKMKQKIEQQQRIIKQRMKELQFKDLEQQILKCKNLVNCYNKSKKASETQILFQIADDFRIKCEMMQFEGEQHLYKIKKDERFEEEYSLLKKVIKQFQSAITQSHSFKEILKSYFQSLKRKTEEYVIQLLQYNQRKFTSEKQLLHIKVIEYVLRNETKVDKFIQIRCIYKVIESKYMKYKIDLRRLAVQQLRIYETFLSQRQSHSTSFEGLITALYICNSFVSCTILEEQGNQFEQISSKIIQKFFECTKETLSILKFSLQIGNYHQQIETIVNYKRLFESLRKSKYQSFRKHVNENILEIEKLISELLKSPFAEVEFILNSIKGDSSKLSNNIVDKLENFCIFCKSLQFNHLSFNYSNNSNDQIKEYQKKIFQVIRPLFEKLNSFGEKNHQENKNPKILYFNLSVQELDEVIQLLQFFIGLKSKKTIKEIISNFKSNIFISLENIQKEMSSYENQQKMEQYWKYISKNQNEVELAAIRKLLNSLKALDYVDKQLPKNTPSTPSKVCNLNSLELTSKKFSFEKWFTIIDQRYRTYVTQYLPTLSEKIIKNESLNIVWIQSQIKSIKNFSNYLESKQYSIVWQRVIDYIEQQYKNIQQMVSANIYVSDIDEKKKIINKQITRIEKYVKNFNFCKKNFNNEIQNLIQYDFDKFNTKNFFAFYHKQFENIAVSIETPLNLTNDIDYYLKIEYNRFRITNHYLFHKQYFSLQFLQLFSSYRTNVAEIKKIGRQYTKEPISENWSPGQFLQQKNRQSIDQFSRFVKGESEISFETIHKKQYCQYIQKLPKQLRQTGRSRIQSVIRKQNDQFRERVIKGASADTIQQEIKTMYAHIPSTFFSVNEKQRIVSEIRKMQSIHYSSTIEKFEKVSTFHSHSDFLSEVHNYQNVRNYKAMNKILKVMENRKKQRIHKLIKQYNFDFKDYWVRFWRFSEEELTLIRNEQKLQSLYESEEKIKKIKEIIRKLNINIDQGLYTDQHKELIELQQIYFFFLLDTYQRFGKGQTQLLALCRQFFYQLKSKCTEQIRKLATCDVQSFFIENTSQTIERFIVSLKVKRDYCRILQSKMEQHKVDLVSRSLSQPQFTEHVQFSSFLCSMSQKVQYFSNYLSNFEFYNDKIKNYGKQELQKLIVTMANAVKSLEKLIHKKILREIISIGQINLNTVVESLTQKRIEFARKSIEQMALIFQPQNSVVSNSAQVYLFQKEIMQKNSLSFVNFLHKQDHDLANNLETKFIQLQTDLEKSFNEIKKLEEREKQEIAEAKKNHHKSLQSLKERELWLGDSVSTSLSKIMDPNEKGKKYITQSMLKQNETVFTNKKTSAEKSLQSDINLIQLEHKRKREKVLATVLSDIIITEKLNLSLQHQRIQKVQSSINTQLLRWVNTQQQRNVTELKQLMKLSVHQNAAIASEQYEIFKSIKAQQFTHATERTSKLQDVLQSSKSFSSNQNLKISIRAAFTLYSQRYQQILKEYKDHPNNETLNKIVNSIQNHQISRIQIIATILSLWSILRMDKSVIEFVIAPHTSQIVAILILVGAVQTESIIKNTLVQILTGEGKSIVLAVICCFFAVNKYKVYCTCYSQYLSKRDKSAFNELFELLKVKEHISYGIFSGQCENLLNPNESQTFRSAVSEFILQKQSQQLIDKMKSYLNSIFDFPNSSDLTKKVLVIDEIDVFFDERFYGKLYCPSINITNENIQNLIKLIWQKAKNAITLQNDQIIKTNEFKRVVDDYPHLRQFMENQINGMISAAIDPNHLYYLKDNEIVYKVEDTLTSAVSFGYKTVFAYCLEYERGRVQKKFYEKALKIEPIIAQFSYAQLPRYFQTIVGVSGTIETMSKYQKEELEKYQFKQSYLIPSIYGSNQDRFVNNESQYEIVETTEFYSELTDKITAIRSETVTTNNDKTIQGRPIIVIFQKRKELEQFFSFKQYQNRFAAHTFCLNESNDEWTRNMIIKRSCEISKITLITEDFSRGTDFVSYDKQVEELGGLFVILTYMILTYIPKNYSEFKQALGRTARHGKKGEFTVFLPDSELSKMGITAMPTVMETLKTVWAKHQFQMKTKIKAQIDLAKEKHDTLDKLVRGKDFNQVKFIQYLSNVNEVNEGNVRTIIGIDATSSMTDAIGILNLIISTVFTRTFEIIELANVKATFAIEIFAYRNYNVSDAAEAFFCSGFHNNPKSLISYFRKCEADGGINRQAMQLLFQHANSLAQLSQIIVIADMAAQTKQQMEDRRRKYKGEKFWFEHFSLSDSEQEIKKLKSKGILIHSYYLGDQSYFERISRETNGDCEQFRINDSDSAQRLAQFIASKILKKIGGKRLVNLYEQRYANMK